MPFADHVYSERLQRARLQMERLDVDALLVSLGSDLPYLTGATAMASERLTLLVVGRSGMPVLVVPGLEAALMPSRPEVFDIRTWGETEDPWAIVVELLGGARKIAFGDQVWAQFLVELLRRRPGLQVVRSSEVLSPLMSRKDAAELEAMRRASAAADRVIARLQRGEIPLVGRSEAEVSRQLADLLIEEGHQKANFTLVASGAHAASPHHHAGERLIRSGESVLFDIGGIMDGYCSDMTRCVHLGKPPTDFQDAYDVLLEAQAAGVAAATVGTPCGEIDAAARQIIEAAGYGDEFIHRLGHGIGMSVHEDPYIVEGNEMLLAPGHCFSIEPGIYRDGQWGMRLEDLVIAHDSGPEPLNQVAHQLVVLDV